MTKILKFVAKIRDSGTSTSKVITVPIEIETEIGKAYQFSIEVDQ